jgi:hypothetical protein
VTKLVTSRLITLISYMKDPPKEIPDCVVLGCKSKADYCIKNRGSDTIEWRCCAHVNTFLEAHEGRVLVAPKES